MARLEELITTTDYEKLVSFLAKINPALEGLDPLEEKLFRLKIVEPDQAPADLITMHTSIECSMYQEGEGKSFQEMSLVFPHEADIEKKQISILAPLGIALLGTCVGSTINWCGPDGKERQMNIRRIIYQPEACGDWHR